MNPETIDLTQRFEDKLPSVAASKKLHKLLTYTFTVPNKHHQQQQKQQQQLQQQQPQQGHQTPTTSNPENTNLKCTRLSENGFPPDRYSSCAAGFDLRSGETVVIKAWERELKNTNIAVVLPDGCYGRIVPRSGLLLKYGIHVGAGVIDKDY
ncbi:hypothetical protein J6590_033036 [Homalodisca vitripennis]|nr:hypothetical protein J6590_033036 [Homalodisca vitripennis]